MKVQNFKLTYYNLFLNSVIVIALLYISQNQLIAQSTVLISAGGSVGVSTGDKFYDAGGPAGNDGNTSYTITLTPAVAGESVCVDFTSFKTYLHSWGDADRLEIFDGPTVASNQIGSLQGDYSIKYNAGGTPYRVGQDAINGIAAQLSPGMFCANNAAGVLTFRFNNGFNPQYAGWEGDIVTFVKSTLGCNVNITATPNPICPGDPVNLVAYGDITSPSINTDFNNSTMGAGWNSTPGSASFFNVLGCQPNNGYNTNSGSTYLWMQNVAAPRILESNGFDVSSGGWISFDFRQASDDNGGNGCEALDDKEGVYVQYSTNNGGTWTTFKLMFPSTEGGGLLGCGEYVYDWNTTTLPIPAAAQTANTSFRWIQTKSSSASTDSWGIDEIKISTRAVSTLTITDQGTGLVVASTTVNDSVQVTLNPAVTTTYIAKVSNGIDSCQTPITVTVAPCTGCTAATGGTVASTSGSSTNVNTAANQYILCNNDSFLVDTTGGYSAATGANPALDYAIYICAPTAGVHPENDPCFSGAFIETPPTVGEINNGGNASNIITYLNGIGKAPTNNTVWIVPITLSISALNANVWDTTCYDMGTPYQVTYLNPITTNTVVDCSNGSVTVTVSGGHPEFFVGNYNITNIGAGTLSSPTIASHGGAVTISGLSNGDSYEISIVDDNGCDVTNIAGVFVSAEIDSVVVVNGGCNSAFGQLTVFASNTTGIVDYSVNGNVQTNNSLFTGLAAGAYTVKVIDANGCSDSIVVNISANQGLSYDVVGTNLNCFGDTSGTITFSRVTGGDTKYAYSIDNGANYQISPSFTGLGAGIYLLSVTDSSGCSLDSTITITAPDEILLNSFVINDASCNGYSDGTITASVVGGTPIYNYAWSNALAGVGQSQAINVAAGTYSLTVTDLNGCTVDTLNFVVAEPLPIVLDSLIVQDETCFGVCDGSINLYSTTANGFGISGGPLTAVNQFLGLCNGIYNLQLSNATGCLLDTVANINSPQPIVVSASAAQTICIGQNVNLGSFSTGGVGTIVYTWDNGVGVGQNPNVSPVITSTYTVTATDDNNCPSSAATQTITVRDSLKVTAFNDVTICEGDAVQIQAAATGGDGNYTFLWDNGAGAGNPVNVLPQTTTVYNVTLTDGCGTPEDNASVTVTVQSSPVVSFSNTFTGCGNVLAKFISDNVNDPSYYNATFLWEMGNGANATTRDSSTYNFTVPGCYDVTYTITDSVGCVGTSTVLNAVCVYENPVADFSYAPDDINIMSSEVLFQDESTGNNISTYSWTFGPNVQIATSNISSPIVTFPDVEEGTYQACLKVVDENQCVDSICKDITVEGVLFFYVPNAFTPDANSMNDEFKPVLSGVEVSDYQLLIYDRWGELLFVSGDVESGWDGSYKNLPAKNDVYVWKINFEDPVSRKKINEVGKVTLLR